MRKQKFLALALALLFIFITAFASIHWWRTAHQQNSSVLSFLPRDSTAVIYVDLASLRQTSFLAQLSAWAPQPQKDWDYAKFVQETGFDFERDLDHLAIATQQFANVSAHFVVADGNFDRQKISAYALRSGVKQNSGGREIFNVPLDAGKGNLSFTFVTDRLLVLTDSGALAGTLANAEKQPARNEWQQRFDRLAGSPAFAVIRQETGLDLADKAPGGFRSPQLATLLNQLQWITIAAKPDADQLRIVTEGEWASEATTRQLADVLNGIVILAQAGLNDPKLRQQLSPIVREAYVDMLKSADISKLDRGDTKAVRLVFSVPPKFLEAARTSLPLTAAPTKPNSTRPAPSSQRKPGT